MAPGALRVAAAPADAELIADRCWFLGATAVAERAGEGSVTLDIGFPSEADAGRAAGDLADRFPGTPATLTDATDALAAALDAWREHAQPERAGERLVVWPAWLPIDAPGDDVVVVIDPLHAFGNGAHPSTRRCLEAVERHVGAGAAVLDVGCGSGVLAVAAALLGAGRVVAVDVDAAAVEATRANADRNGVRIDARHAPLADVDGRFDLVLANIGAAAALGLAPALAERVAPRGRLVVAGLVAAREDDVRAGFADHGFDVAAVERDGEWVCIHHARAKLDHTDRVKRQTMEEQT